MTQVFINRAGPAAQSVAGITFSPDTAQRFLYLADYGNSRVLVLDRKSLQVLYQFGDLRREAWTVPRPAPPGRRLEGQPLRGRSLPGQSRAAVRVQGDVITRAAERADAEQLAVPAK